MYHTELIEFPTSDNLSLPGVLFTPQKKTKKVCIFLHGNGSASVFYSQKRTKVLARRLVEQGIAFLAFNNRGAHFIKTINRADPLQSTNKDQNPFYDDVTLGTAYELIKDCTYDINGAVKFLQDQGYQEFYLIGHSSGANKICVYDHYQPRNLIHKYVLLSGGDDTGLYFQLINNKDKFFQYLQQAKKKIAQGKGEELIPEHIAQRWLSYQSFYDTANPDGDYNTFPFFEYTQKLNLSTKPLFRYFKKITKPCLVIYGELDHCVPEGNGRLAIEILSLWVKNKENFTFHVIPEADHGFHEQEAELAQKITGWLA